VQWQASNDGGASWVDEASTAGSASGALIQTELSFTAQANENGDLVRAIFTNSLGAATTNAALLTVLSQPAILTQPVDQTVNAGGTATFTASASGNPTPTVQWLVSTDGGNNFTHVTGATSTTLTLNNVTTGQNGTLYQAVFDNSVGTTFTNAALLSVNSPPAITSTNSATFTVGQSGSFQVTATGMPTPTFSESGALPSGVTLSSDGFLEGTPTSGTAGSYSITIRASNGITPDATQNFTLVINSAPVCNTTPCGT
jgi:hypothetical protein